ncbi:hypothetical protein NDU88_002874 [Pleurodeles waltl]|uniref:Uncharacterized protein n=1 Tax=Pleurodeles waltl TaxID=8319 RepID=A0AAV7WT08_PLEWA|nr:hypothetical protein NDU88_002874 [Pleurodeles waltl]
MGRGSGKDVRQEEAMALAKEGAIDSGIIPSTTENPVSESSGKVVADLIVLNAGADAGVSPHTPSSSLGKHSSICRAPGALLMEAWMGQILEELRAIKQSQEVAHQETKHQLCQLNTHLTHLSTRLTQVEQRVSDLEDAGNQAESTIRQIQSELEELQLKLD